MGLRLLRVHRSSTALLSAAALVLAGCGDDLSSSASEGDTATSSSAGPGTTVSATATGPGTTSETGTSAGPTGPTESTSDSAGTTQASTSDSSSSTGFKFDVGDAMDAGVADCDCGMASEFSYIWIANSPESTVSKINTTTVLEEGRYLTSPTGDGNPSRTSVSISGRAVAVANRHAGLTKVWANEADCDPNKNGMPGVQTSQGDQVLPWGEDDCIAWHNEFDDWTVQRPVAWAPGVFNEATCQWEDEKVWTAGCGGGNPGYGSGPTTVRRVNGDTGEVEDNIFFADYSCSGFGPYGAAVDQDGNLWMTLNNGPLGFVDAETLETTVYQKPDGVCSYGMTVDNKGRPWVTAYCQNAGVARFDPESETWAQTAALISYGQSGIAQGADGRIWVAGTFNGTSGVASLDPETLDVLDIIGATSSGKGVSIDADGNVWRAGWTMATRINPDDQTFEVHDGLNGAYSYSDMTGFGVANAAGCQPQG